MSKPVVPVDSEAAPLLGERAQREYGTGDIADESALHPALASTDENADGLDGKQRVSPLTVVRIGTLEDEMRAEVYACVCAGPADVDRHLPRCDGRHHHRGVVCKDWERAQASAEHELDRDRVHAHVDELPVSAL